MLDTLGKDTALAKLNTEGIDRGLAHRNHSVSWLCSVHIGAHILIRVLLRLLELVREAANDDGIALDSGASFSACSVDCISDMPFGHAAGPLPELAAVRRR